MEQSFLDAMPRYRCHKEVRALKIEKLLPKPDGTAITTILRCEGGFMVKVGAQYMLRNNPEPGGYYVVYEDGYESFSPAKAFEDGYTRI
jgi:hypothetical protein